MFGLFRKRPPRPTERVFGTSEHRADALAAAARKARTEQKALALVVPFHESAEVLHALMLARGVHSHVYGPSSFRQFASDEGVPIVEQQTFLSSAPRIAQGAPLLTVMVERHPMRVYDEQVISAVQALGAGSSLEFLLSLDDGVFSLMGDGLSRIRTLIRALDMSESEPLEHSAISGAVENLQEKVAKRVRAEQPARSFEAWRSLNLL